MPPPSPPIPPASILLAGIAETEALARRLAATLHPGTALLLEGTLGAGKTTLARALLRTLAGNPALEVPSPTYTLVQEYPTSRGPAFHYDLWRLAGPDGLDELNWEEAQEGIVLVEWPDRLAHRTPPHARTLHLAILNDTTRQARLTPPLP